MSKCPKCEKEIENAHIQPMNAITKSNKSFKSIAFLCPECSSILGIQIDPLASDNDLLNKIRGMMLSLPK